MTQGFSLVEGIIVVTVVVLGGVLGYVYMTKSSTQAPVVTAPQTIQQSTKSDAVQLKKDVDAVDIDTSIDTSEIDTVLQ